MRSQDGFEKYIRASGMMQLTSRSNMVLEEDVPEGLQSLPLESPMNTEKFEIRRQYLN